MIRTESRNSGVISKQRNLGEEVTSLGVKKQFVNL